MLLGALVLQERLDKNPEWHAVAAIAALAVALLGAVIIASAIGAHEPISVAARRGLITRHRAPPRPLISRRP